VLGVVFTNIPSKEKSPRAKGPEADGLSTGVVLEGYDAPQHEPASTARLWL
jgi:hypothetical protein